MLRTPALTTGSLAANSHKTFYNHGDFKVRQVFAIVGLGFYLRVISAVILYVHIRMIRLQSDIMCRTWEDLMKQELQTVL